MTCCYTSDETRLLHEYFASNFRVKEYLLLTCFSAITTVWTLTAPLKPLVAVTRSTNQFASSLFQAVAKENPGNLIMSPLSVSVALAMAAYGARGETEKQLKDVLRLPHPDRLGTAGFQELIDNINYVEEENKLCLANKVFVDEGYPVKPSYTDLTQTYFRSAAQSVNFARPLEAANIVNTWVQQSTNYRIQNVVTPAHFSERTGIVLVNAVYFKGHWKNVFFPAFTEDRTFHVNEYKERDVPTMHRLGSYKYGELPELNARMIEIPYEGNHLSMVIILPDKINGLAAVKHKLNSISMADILNRGYERDVKLYLPKFKIESRIELNSVLKKLGLTNMFSDQANFSGIADDNLAVTRVVQKAFIEVNERGSEGQIAVLASAPVWIDGSRRQDEPVVFDVDKPFYFAIKYDNVVLLSGVQEDFD